MQYGLTSISDFSQQHWPIVGSRVLPIRKSSIVVPLARTELVVLLAIQKVGMVDP